MRELDEFGNNIVLALLGGGVAENTVTVLGAVDAVAKALIGGVERRDVTFLLDCSRCRYHW